VRARNEGDLVQQVCAAVVEDGGYLFAWVGYAKADDDLQPVAVAGEDSGYLDGSIAWNDRGGQRYLRRVQFRSVVP
jgi:hypothetical protein